MKREFTPFPILTTERLVLRQLENTDAGEIFQLRTDVIVNQYIDRPKTNSVEEAEEFINKIKKAIKEHQSILWGINFQNESALIGTICLWNISEEQSKSEIGFELLPQYHGRGIMKEAIPSVIDYGFQKMELHSIDAVIHPGNYRSIQLMEKNKFIRNTNNDDQVENLLVYSLVR